MAYRLSIQPVTVTIGSGQFSNTATITEVSAKAVLIPAGRRTTSTTDNRGAFANIILTDATTVTASRGNSTAAATVSCYVFDAGDDLVDTVQYGSITLSGTSATATISSVDTTRTFPLFLGEWVSTNFGAADDYLSAVDLTNSTTVTASRGDSGGSNFVKFVVCELLANVLESNVQHRAPSITGTNTSDTDTISSVDVDNTILAWGGCLTSTTGATMANGATRAELTAATTVTLTRGGSGSVTRVPKYTVVEFIPGVLNSIARDTQNITSGTTNDDTITAVDLDFAAVMQTGFINISGTVNDNSEMLNTSLLTSITNVRAERDTSTTDDAGSAYEVWEFTDGPVVAAGNPWYAYAQQ